MALIISPKIRQKLADKSPPVAEEEIIQCFANRTNTYLRDKRERNKTNPPTLWFIAETDYGRLLKIVFVPEDGDIFLRTAYVPNHEEKKIYKRFSAKTIKP